MKKNYMIKFGCLILCFFCLHTICGPVFGTDISDEPGVGQKRPSSSSSDHEENLNKKHYAIATTDTAFKHLLSVEGDNQDLMCSFLQTFVPTFETDRISTIESHPVAIPTLREKGEKQTFMDLHVRTQSGTHYIIEMQAKRHIMFDERALYRAC